MASSSQRYNGLLLFNKQAGVSSHDAVQEVRRTIRQKRIGHTGTLDPLATGLLVMCVGQATKISRFVCDYYKTYNAEVCLGKRSTTFDAEGVIEDSFPTSLPELSKADIKKLLLQFHGRIRQKVPVYSAVSVGGRRLYDMARKSEAVEPPTREVDISRIELLDYKAPFLSLEVTCSSGTYIRSLANDIGESLGCGAYLSNLSRIAIGSMKLESALSIDEVKHHFEADDLDAYIHPVETVLDYSAVEVSEQFGSAVVTGRKLAIDDVCDVQGTFNAGDTILLKDRRGRALAIGTAEVSSDLFHTESNIGLFKYMRVLN